jgi:hypothetical protein
MVDHRWYATATTTQPIARLNGQDIVMISGGTDRTVPGPSMPHNSYETYKIFASTNPSGFLGVDDDPSPSTAVVYAGPDDPGTPNLIELLNIYPRLHVLSDDTLFLSGPGGKSAKVDQDVTALPTGSPPPAPQFARPWDLTAARNSPIAFRDDGSSVLMHTLGDDFVLRVGGDDPVTAPGAPPVATDVVEVCHANAAALPVKWTQFGNLPGGPRVYANAVVLPDMSVLVLGGRSARGALYVMDPDLYRPGLGWSSVNAPSPTRRGYHATAVLLPDGRVLVGGGELDTPQSSGERDYDIYVPHYLQGNPQRPVFYVLTDVLTGASVSFDSTNFADLLQRGQSYRAKFDDIGELDQLEKIVLMAPGAITHHSDMSARYVDISGTAVNHNTRQFTIPANGAVPRGFYMLFGLNSAGIPSVARWVKVL